jgi:septation ring formation regulator EzrA
LEASREGEDVEHYEWMNEQVRQEIEDLQRTYGFDEDEATAYWHLRHAGTLLLAMKRTGAPEIAEEVDESTRLARMVYGRSQIESNIVQHLSALRRELGDRVLRRNYPEGWGSAHKALDE